MENYKGIYYNETKDQKYYEGGAHFPYKILFNILLDLGGTIPKEEYSFNKYKNYNNLMKKPEERIRVKHESRNLEQKNNLYRNNPNTLVKYPSQNMICNKENNKKNYISRNYNNSLHSDYNNINNKSYATSIYVNQSKKNLDNHLLQILLNKKEKKKQNEEKNNDENDNRYSLLNFYKTTHYRNKSEYYTNIENNKTNIINKDEKTKGNVKNDFATFIKNKINLIKGYNRGKISLENNGKNKESFEINGKTNKNYEINDVIKCKPKNKPYLNYFVNMTKKSRNIDNNNIMEYKNIYENNKDSNYNQKFSINYLFKTSDDKQNNEYEMKNNVTLNKNAFQKNLSNNYGNAKTNNINHKETIVKQIPNNLGIIKYKKKKINQLCCFNHNNGKVKSGNNIFAKNINQINIIHNRIIIK